MTKTKTLVITGEQCQREQLAGVGAAAWSDDTVKNSLRKHMPEGCFERGRNAATLSKVTRREAITLVGISVGTGLVTLVGPTGGFGAVFQAGVASSAVFPDGAIIRTLMGDVSPDKLRDGPVLFHEHLSGTTEFSDDVALMVEEVRAGVADGIACIVDAGHPDMKFTPGGYRLEALKRITRQSGMPIVASGGYYTQQSYPPEIAVQTANQIADGLVQEATVERLGALGEIGQGRGEMTADERKVFQAVGRAHLRTGLPIFTHSPYIGRRRVSEPVPPEAALRQLDVFESEGVQPEHVALGHVCCLDDPKARVAQQAAKRGAFVGFDRVTLETVHLPDADRIVMIMALLDAGYADNLLLSSEFYAESSLKKNGGPGIAQAATVFGPKLLRAGVPEATLHQILVDNPRRFLAFVPRVEK